MGVVPPNTVCAGRRWIVVLLPVILASAACSDVGSNSPLRTYVPSVDNQGRTLCQLTQSTAFLLEATADAADPVWGRRPDGSTLLIAWPPGFSVRFSPQAEVVDSLGRVVARQGEEISDAGGDVTASGILNVCEIAGHAYP